MKTVREVSKLTGISVRTLLYYDSVERPSRTISVSAETCTTMFSPFQTELKCIVSVRAIVQLGRCSDAN